MALLTVEQQALIAEVGKAWVAYKAERIGAEARIRALVAAEVAKSVDAARDKVSAALAVALNANVPKVRLREVTTKDRPSFAALVASPLLVGAQPALEPLRFAWEGTKLRVTIDPALVPNPESDADDPRCWTTFVNRYRSWADALAAREEPEGRPNGDGVREWIERDANNRVLLFDWAENNPR